MGDLVLCFILGNLIALRRGLWYRFWLIPQLSSWQYRLVFIYSKPNIPVFSKCSIKAKNFFSFVFVGKSHNYAVCVANGFWLPCEFFECVHSDLMSCF